MRSSGGGAEGGKCDGSCISFLVLMGMADATAFDDVTVVVSVGGEGETPPAGDAVED